MRNHLSSKPSQSALLRLWPLFLALIFLQLAVSNCTENSNPPTANIECDGESCYLKIFSNKKALQNMAAAHEKLFHKYASNENGEEGIDEHGLEKLLEEVGLMKDEHGGHGHDGDEHGGHDEDEHGGHGHDEDEHGEHELKKEDFDISKFADFFYNYDYDDENSTNGTDGGHDEDEHGGHDEDGDEHGGHDEDEHGGHDEDGEHDEDGDEHGGHDEDGDEHGEHDEDGDEHGGHDEHGEHDEDGDEHGEHDEHGGHDEDEHGEHDEDGDEHGGHDEHGEHDEGHGEHDEDGDEHGEHDEDGDEHGEHDEDEHGGHDEHGEHELTKEDFDISKFADFFYDYNYEDENSTSSESEKKLPCISSAEDIFQSYFPKDALLTLGDFAATLPQILLDTSRPECRIAEDHHENDHEDEDDESDHLANKKSEINIKTWIISFASLIIISVAILFIQIFFRSKNLGNTAAFLEAAASGALFGVSLLHLVPQSFLSNDKDHGEEDEEFKNLMWKGLAAWGGMYLFYLLDVIMRIIRLRKSDEDLVAGAERTDKDSNPDAVYSPTASPLLKESAHEEAAKKDLNVESEGEVTLETGKGSNKVQEAYADVACVTLLEDRIQNLLFGFIIGVVFTASTRTGIAASIAVFLYKIPRGLKDFSIVLKSGKTVKQSALSCFIGSFLCLIGLTIGLLVGDFSSAGAWIVALGAGIFFYATLVHMIQPMLEMINKENYTKQFLIQNFGLLLGCAVMLIFAFIKF